MCVTPQHMASEPGPGLAPGPGLGPHRALQELHALYAELTGARGTKIGTGVGTGVEGGSEWCGVPVALDETLIDLELALVSSLRPCAVSSPCPCAVASPSPSPSPGANAGAVSERGCFAGAGCGFAVVKPSMLGLAYLAKYLQVQAQDSCTNRNNNNNHHNHNNHSNANNDNHCHDHDPLPVTLSCTFESGEQPTHPILSYPNPNLIKQSV